MLIFIKTTELTPIKQDEYIKKIQSKILQQKYNSSLKKHKILQRIFDQLEIYLTNLKEINKKPQDSFEVKSILDINNFFEFCLMFIDIFLEEDNAFLRCKHEIKPYSYYEDDCFEKYRQKINQIEGFFNTNKNSIENITKQHFIIKKEGLNIFIKFKINTKFFLYDTASNIEKLLLKINKISTIPNLPEKINQSEKIIRKISFIKIKQKNRQIDEFKQIINQTRNYDIINEKLKAVEQMPKFFRVDFPIHEYFKLTKTQSKVMYQICIIEKKLYTLLSNNNLDNDIIIKFYSIMQKFDIAYNIQKSLYEIGKFHFQLIDQENDIKKELSTKFGDVNWFFKSMEWYKPSGNLLGTSEKYMEQVSYKMKDKQLSIIRWKCAVKKITTNTTLIEKLCEILDIYLQKNQDEQYDINIDKLLKNSSKQMQIMIHKSNYDILKIKNNFEYFINIHKNLRNKIQTSLDELAKQTHVIINKNIVIEDVNLMNLYDMFIVSKNESIQNLNFIKSMVFEQYFKSNQSIKLKELIAHKFQKTKIVKNLIFCSQSNFDTLFLQIKIGILYSLKLHEYIKSMINKYLYKKSKNKYNLLLFEQFKEKINIYGKELPPEIENIKNKLSRRLNQTECEISNIIKTITDIKYIPMNHTNKNNTLNMEFDTINDIQNLYQKNFKIKIDNIIINKSKDINKRLEYKEKKKTLTLNDQELEELNQFIILKKNKIEFTLMIQYYRIQLFKHLNEIFTEPHEVPFDLDNLETYIKKTEGSSLLKIFQNINDNSNKNTINYFDIKLFQFYKTQNNFENIDQFLQIILHKLIEKLEIKYDKIIKEKYISLNIDKYLQKILKIFIKQLLIYNTNIVNILCYFRNIYSEIYKFINDFIETNNLNQPRQNILNFMIEIKDFIYSYLANIKNNLNELNQIGTQTTRIQKNIQDLKFRFFKQKTQPNEFIKTILQQYDLVINSILLNVMNIRHYIDIFYNIKCIQNQSNIFQFMNQEFKNQKIYIQSYLKYEDSVKLNEYFISLQKSVSSDYNTMQTMFKNIINTKKPMILLENYDYTILVNDILNLLHKSALTIEPNQLTMIYSFISNIKKCFIQPKNNLDEMITIYKLSLFDYNMKNKKFTEFILQFCAKLMNYLEPLYEIQNRCNNKNYETNDLATMINDLTFIENVYKKILIEIQQCNLENYLILKIKNISIHMSYKIKKQYLEIQLCGASEHINKQYFSKIEKNNIICRQFICIINSINLIIEKITRIKDLNEISMSSKTKQKKQIKDNLDKTISTINNLKNDKNKIYQKDDIEENSEYYKTEIDNINEQIINLEFTQNRIKKSLDDLNESIKLHNKNIEIEIQNNIEEIYTIAINIDNQKIDI